MLGTKKCAPLPKRVHLHNASKMIRSASYQRFRAIKDAKVHSREFISWMIVLVLLLSMLNGDGSLGSPFGILEATLPYFFSKQRAPGEPPHRHAYLADIEILRHSGDECADLLRIPKVALLFLTSGDLFHEPSWRLWLKSAEGMIPSQVVSENICGRSSLGSEDELASAGKVCTLKPPEQYQDTEYRNQHLFSMYVHVPPSFEGFDPQSLWHGKVVRYRVETQWGAHTLVEATRHLLWEAFRDPLNTRFLLLSESDIPLYDPLTMYQQLQAEENSRLDTCVHDDVSPWRWHPSMETKRLKFHHWRKSPQWMTLTREHAKMALEDHEVYRMFERHCWSAWDDEHSRWHRECFSDEHYFATLLATFEKDSEGICGSRGVSFTLWESKSAHPRSFNQDEITMDLIRKARDGHKTLGGQLLPSCNWQEAQLEATGLFTPANVALDTNSKEEMCESFRTKTPVLSSKMPATCFLTARKFGKDSVSRVKKLFLHCDQDSMFLSKDVCLKEGGAVCDSVWSHMKAMFYKDVC
jgi:hypothetical protein